VVKLPLRFPTKTHVCPSCFLAGVFCATGIANEDLLHFGAKSPRNSAGSRRRTFGSAFCGCGGYGLGRMYLLSLDVRVELGALDRAARCSVPLQSPTRGRCFSKLTRRASYYFFEALGFGGGYFAALGVTCKACALVVVRGGALAAFDDQAVVEEALDDAVRCRC